MRQAASTARILAENLVGARYVESAFQVGDQVTVDGVAGASE